MCLLPLLIKIYLGSLLFKKQFVIRPLVSYDGISFNAWTAISIFSSKSSSSIVLENNPLPPVSESLTSWIMSPVVVIFFISISNSFKSFLSSIFALSAVTLSLFLSVIIKEKFKSIKKLFYIIYAALIWGLSFIAGYLFIVRATAHSGFHTFWAHSFAPIPIRSIDNLLWYSETLFSTIRIPISIYFPGIVILLLFAGFIGFFKKKDKILFFSILFTFIFLFL